MKEDALEALYERRLKKKAVEKQKEESALQVDRVDALPVKTLDGELYYRTGILLFSVWPFASSSIGSFLIFSFYYYAIQYQRNQKIQKMHLIKMKRMGRMEMEWIKV